MPRESSLSLIVFTRLPRAGHAKTRLIPALGAEGAAALQRAMTELTVARAESFCAAAPNRRLVIAYAGGNADALRAWLGPREFIPQGEGDLGDRMERCMAREFARDARRVLVIGTDCPSLQPAHLDAAARALATQRIVFGPAEDGGYYLVGLAQPQPEIFANIPWSTDRVLAESLARARQLGLEPALLATLRDIDEPGDLPHAQAALAAARTVSVVIPTLNESANLRALLPLLSAQGPTEIIVADGGSTDDTVAVARSHGARIVEAPRGRGPQQNAGAAIATGEFLLFLHADTEPPEDFDAIIARALAQPDVTAGAFRFSLREPFAGGWLVERGVALRCAWRQLPYGDQGIFMRRSLFEGLGGFAPWPMLEDLELIRRLRARGRVVITEEISVTSSRRWRERGLVRTFLRHQWILLRYALGWRPQSR